MPIAVFENHRDEALTFIIDPSGQVFEVPPLARIGVRYAFASGAPEWTSASHGERSISFWCDAPGIEVEIVHPMPFDRLLWALCVTYGCCGGIVDGEPVHVTDLLPGAGTVTASQFALAALAAEGIDDGDARARWMPRLEALFRKHMGADEMPAEALARNLANPFD
ncbi:hypothetical protein P1X14_17495 [Sphingomonas sp. AOB5]|uniref:hypothetical protein n=1 Tax=Sphingomonas sp. AOB5 TaxID=3034017 RepID=UPI0023F697D9|nr:hypothetical protein [Sphingomonas sp. AOB5]MDF7777056.1 hypothetical protein [Sphingomonas sp. AOB5]